VKDWQPTFIRGAIPREVGFLLANLPRSAVERREKANLQPVYRPSGSVQRLAGSPKGW
jgi:hypothetical protein